MTRNHLRGPNPPDPDDGSAKLDVGEHIMSARAVRMYGADVMDTLNKGLVSPEAVRSFFGR